MTCEGLTQEYRASGAKAYLARRASRGDAYRRGCVAIRAATVYRRMAIVCLAPRVPKAHR